ncbi:MAG: GTP cyclohydrolase I FolE [Flavobacteriales bacterium]
MTLNGNPAAHAAMEDIGDQHAATSADTPLLPNAFDLSDDEKIARIEPLFAQIMDVLGLDRGDDSLSGTPYRVAKMYVKEIFQGLNPDNAPAAKVFDNSYQYGEMLVEKNIRLNSTCEHHFLPIYGKAHVAYISSGKVVGLSKINRIVDYYARRPQVQERLTRQISLHLQRVLETVDVAVVIDAKHMCVSARGIQDETSSTVTAEYAGAFKDPQTRTEFLKYLDL